MRSPDPNNNPAQQIFVFSPVCYGCCVVTRKFNASFRHYWRLCEYIICAIMLVGVSGCQRSSLHYCPVQETAYITPDVQSQWTKDLRRHYDQMRRRLEQERQKIVVSPDSELAKSTSEMKGVEATPLEACKVTKKKGSQHCDCGPV